MVNSDVLSAEVHLAKLTQEEMTAASQVKIAQSALGTVLGLQEAGERPLAPAPKEPAPLPPRLDDLKQTAQEKRPDLKQLELASRVAQQEYSKARLNYLPRLHVVAEYDVDQRRLFGNSADSYTVMALLNFNLFNGLVRPGQGEGDPGQRVPGPGFEAGPGGPGPAPGDRGHLEPEDGP